MIYPYHCRKCDNEFEVVKPFHAIEFPEPCPDCGMLSDDRRIGLPMIQSVEVDPYFHYGLGKVVRTKGDIKNELKKREDQGRGLIEIGDEPIHKIEKKFSAEREEKRNKRWAEPVEKILQDVNHGR